MKTDIGKLLRGRKLPAGPLFFGLFGIALAVVLVVVALNGRAQEADTGRGISISPLKFEFNVDPGQQVSDVIRIFNAGADPIFASVKIEDTSPTGERGQAIIGEAGSTRYSIAEWTMPDQDVIEVQPGEQRAINFTLSVPPDAEPGGHYGALTVENLPGNLSEGSSGVVFAQKVAALMLVSVSGDVAEEVSISDFFIATEETPIRYDWIPTNWILDPTEITFVTRFENTGSVHEKPAGFVTVTSALGNELTKLPIDQRNVLPDQKRVIETTWQPDGLTLGKIRAQVDAVYGSKSQSLFAAAEFWVVPVTTLGPWVIGIFIGLILMLILRKRLWAALKIILRGDKSGGAKKSGGGNADNSGETPSQSAQGDSEINPRAPGSNGEKPFVT